MATKIGGDQLRLEDFVKNPTPNGDWSSPLFTASLAAIKALMSASGITELSGTVKLWEKEGLYIVKGNSTINTGGRSFRTNTDALLLVTSLYSSYNYKNYICINGMGHVHIGTTYRNGGTIYYSSLREFVGAGDRYSGSNGIVPEPQAGDNEKFLKGDGTWGEPNVFDGATSSEAGQKGAVPAPQAGDNEKFLKGDGTWEDKIEKITGEVNIWELQDGIYLFDEEFVIKATPTQNYPPLEKGYISILQNPIYDDEKNYYAITARGFMTYGVTSEYTGSINQAMLQTLSGSILEIGKGCLVPGKKNEDENFYTLTGKGWSPGLISLVASSYAYSWNTIQLKRILSGRGSYEYNCSERYIQDLLVRGGKVLVWSRTEEDGTYRMYEADNENGTIENGNVVLRNISYQNGNLVVREFRAQTSGQTEYWQLTQHVI